MRVNLIAQILQLLPEAFTFQFRQTPLVVATAEIALDAEVNTKHQNEHHDGQRHQEEAPAAQDAPGGPAVLHVGEAEEARNDRTGLVEGEEATNL